MSRPCTHFRVGRGSVSASLLAPTPFCARGEDVEVEGFWVASGGLGAMFLAYGEGCGLRWSPLREAPPMDFRRRLDPRRCVPRLMAEQGVT
jgi:hypothetical protein